MYISGLLFTEQPHSLPAEVDMSSQASGIISAPIPKAAGGSAAKAKDCVLGEYPGDVSFYDYWMITLQNTVY